MAASAADPPTPLFWTLIVIVTALCLTLVVAAQIAARYSSAYFAAPREIATFIDTIDDSVYENESYDRDVARVQRLEDKIRLGRLLREIQKSGDDLREALNGLFVDEHDSTELRTSARILWAGHRKELEERIRRLDLLRMRFLTVYMGIIATSLSHRDKQAAKAESEKLSLAARNIPPPPPLPRSLSENIKTTEIMKKKPSLRRLRGPSIGHSEKVAPPQRMGWMGVVAELQRSPLLQRRHASIESAMRSPLLTPLGSPTPSSMFRDGDVAPPPFNLDELTEKGC
ncbi:hypothetical protein LQW54_003369 [Pestalotiopsis sp. IQ-011]